MKNKTINYLLRGLSGILVFFTLFTIFTNPELTHTQLIFKLWYLIPVSLLIIFIKHKTDKNE